MKAGCGPALGEGGISPIPRLRAWGENLARKPGLRCRVLNVVREVLLPGAGGVCGFKRRSSFREHTNYSSIFSPLISTSFKAKHPGKLFQQYPLSNVPCDRMVFLQLQRDSEIPERVSVPSKEVFLFSGMRVLLIITFPVIALCWALCCYPTQASHPPRHMGFILLTLDTDTET